MLQVLGMHIAALYLFLQATTISVFLFIFIYFLYIYIYLQFQIIMDAVMEKYILFCNIPIFWKRDVRTDIACSLYFHH